MTWPFENDTSAITKKLAKKSLQSEKRRNLMVVIAVALAAFLICFTGIVSTSLTQMQRNQVVDTYEAVWLGVEENDIETLKGLPEFERVGGYYMLGEELSEQGYHASYVYCDAQMMEITKAQMELLEGRVPEKANEVVVSEYFLSTYGNNAKIGDTVTLDTESFHGDYVVTGIMDSVNEKEANTCAIILSNAALTEWKGFDPTGYRAYVHFKNSDQLGEELMTSYCREIAEEYQLPIDYDFTVCKVTDYSLVNWNTEYCFIGKTEDENSLVCFTRDVPQNVIKRDDGWKVFRIQEILDFSLIGILSRISGILAKESISVFAVSTFNTDYIFVKNRNYEKAMEILKQNGYSVVE